MKSTTFATLAISMLRAPMPGNASSSFAFVAGVNGASVHTKKDDLFCNTGNKYEPRVVLSRYTNRGSPGRVFDLTFALEISRKHIVSRF
jgi:hypothetical protein